MSTRRFVQTAVAFIAGLVVSPFLLEHSSLTLEGTPSVFDEPATRECPACQPCVQSYDLQIQRAAGTGGAAGAGGPLDTGGPGTTCDVAALTRGIRTEERKKAELALKRKEKVGARNCNCPSIVGKSMFSDAILPLMRDWGCGHENLEIPRILVPQLGGRNMEPEKHGRGRFIIDVGLGNDAEETMKAVSQGFVVFSFDPDGGNIAQLRVTASMWGIESRFYFVPLTAGEPPDLDNLPLPPDDGQGFAYVFFAGLGRKIGTASYEGEFFSYEGQVKEVTPGEKAKPWKPTRPRDFIEPGRENDPEELLRPRGPVYVPLVTLDSCLPDWVDEIYFAKIDTQGAELNVLKGATKILEQGLARYILFEYSPKLMEWGDLGNHTELLQLLPKFGYVGFDMMGEHLALPRASTPLSKYQSQLLEWDHWADGVPFPEKQEDRIGPWEDLLWVRFERLLMDDLPKPKPKAKPKKKKKRPRVPPPRDPSYSPGPQGVHQQGSPQQRAMMPVPKLKKTKGQGGHLPPVEEIGFAREVGEGVGEGEGLDEVEERGMNE